MNASMSVVIFIRNGLVGKLDKQHSSYETICFGSKETNPFRLSALLILLAIDVSIIAGPPYRTDDPDPIGYHCWGFYVASQLEHSGNMLSGTAPHVEIDYGCIRNIMLHLIVPLSFQSTGSEACYGFGDLETGFLYRFLNESHSVPEIGIFPQLSVPSGNAQKGLGEGHIQIFLPLWIKKMWKHFELYGGEGFGMTTISNINSSYWYTGAVFQYEVSDHISTGAEIFNSTASSENPSETGFNIGIILTFTEMHSLLFSAGRDISGSNNFQMYIGYLLTIGEMNNAQ